MKISSPSPRVWPAGRAPIAVVLITLNEARHLRGVLENLAEWAQEVFIVDSFSSDETVDVAAEYGVPVVQRRFNGFGDQWNFALRVLPITAPWTMKLDPDERLTDPLKESICSAISCGSADGFQFRRRLWFMGRPLPIKQLVLRVWRTGQCAFTDVLVNEHPRVDGSTRTISGELEHHDSPDLHHWIAKQNQYTSAEAISRYRRLPFAAFPRLLGDPLERRMWFKTHFMRVPLRYQLMFLLILIRVQPWRTGRTGLVWARSRVWVRRTIEDKLFEMATTGREIQLPASPLGESHPSARQCAE